MNQFNWLHFVVKKTIYIYLQSYIEATKLIFTPLIVSVSTFIQAQPGWQTFKHFIDEEESLYSVVFAHKYCQFNSNCFPFFYPQCPTEELAKAVQIINISMFALHKKAKHPQKSIVTAQLNLNSSWE